MLRQEADEVGTSCLDLVPVDVICDGKNRSNTHQSSGGYWGLGGDRRLLMSWWLMVFQPPAN